MSKVADLLEKAKGAIAAGEKYYREAAELVAQAQEAGATQKQIADRIGKSQPWISQLLAWRTSGYHGGAFERSHKARISRANKSKGKPASTGEQARAQRARAHADAEKAKAQHAKAEAAKARAEAKAEAARLRAERERTRRRMFEMMHGMEPKEIHSGTRTLIVKALGMLGSAHDNEVLVAARKVEGLRKRTGLTWNDLIIEAIPAAREAAA